MRRHSAVGVTVCLMVSALAAPVTHAADEISPACGIYQANHILVDGFVNKPGISLTVDQLAAMPDQKNIDISFVDRLGKTQHHSESGPLLWTVLSAAGGIRTPAPVLEQYQGPNPLVTLFVLMIATNGYQSLVSEAEIDPTYGNQPVLVSLVEDGKPMTDAPYSTTNKAPAELVVPGDLRGGRYANRICHIVVLNGALASDDDRSPRGIF